MLGANFNDNGRWSSTFVNGTGLAQGDPTTLRWSIVSDGLNVEGNSSNLVAYLDGLYGTSTGSDLTTRPWYPILADQFANLAAKTGLDFVYIPDNGSAWNDEPASGAYGDIRLAGFDLPAARQLGEAALPSQGGDIWLDTANASFANASTLGKVFQHEIGHALGMLHVTVQGHSVLMNTSTLPGNGPQFDDLFGLTRLYGDAYESATGNDTMATATQLGTLTPGVVQSIGADAADQTVLRDEFDFASIDGASDIDYYQFDVASPSNLTLSLIPRGPAYTYTPQFLSPVFVDASRLSKVSLRLLDASTGTPILTLNQGELGEGQTISQFDLPAAGSYAIEVVGDRDDNQFYEVQLQATPTVASDSFTVFKDRFDLPSTDLNQQLDSPNRQGGGNVKSPYVYTDTNPTSSDFAAQLSGGELQLTATKGDTESSSATLMRNFAPQVQGERWLLSFDLTIDASQVSEDAAFHFVMDDAWPVGDAMSDEAEISLRLAANGDYLIEENGDRPGGFPNTGNRFAESYRVQMLVDETSLSPRITLAINGVNTIRNNPVVLDAGRYLSFEASTLAGLPIGESLTTSIDNLSIVVLTEAIPGDYNLDGIVDLADYNVWRNNLGERVLTGTVADGDDSGYVDAGDYQVWKNNFGSRSDLAVASTEYVPEPKSLVLFVLAAIAGLARLRRPAV